MKFDRVLLLYIFMLLIECLANGFHFFPVQLLSKPSLMLILLFYFWSNSKKLSSSKNLIIAALVFSWFGDVILLFEKQYEFLFVYGLVSFLAAHIFYLLYFWRIGIIYSRLHKIKPVLMVVIFIYSALFYWILFPNLGGLELPVLGYISVISLMLIAAFHAFDFTNNRAATIILAGTILFVLSDSILAVNRFVFPIPIGSVFVMLSYALGQLFITVGALRILKAMELK